MPSERQILHVDMDAFYASVEQRDRPELRGRPVAVGGPSERGVVCAASYEARPFGVASAIPTRTARRLCRELIVVPPRMSHYRRVSRQVFEIFSRFTPDVEALSLDEAFLDVTRSESLFGDGMSIATEIRKAIRSELDLPASAGVAPNKFVAKVASDLAKPDGVKRVTEGSVALFLAPLPITRMWGVGPKTAPRLRDLGLHTFGDIARADLHQLERHVGSLARHIGRLAVGHDERDVVADRDPKTLGSEETFDTDLANARDLERKLLEQSSRVAHRLTSHGLYAGSVQLKVKYADFSSKTRSTVLPAPIADTQSIYEAALVLLARVPLRGRRVRLTGVSAGHLSASPPEATLFDDGSASKRKAVENLVHDVHAKLGLHLTRATLLERGSRRVGAPV